VKLMTDSNCQVCSSAVSVGNDNRGCEDLEISNNEIKGGYHGIGFGTTDNFWDISATLQDPFYAHKSVRIKDNFISEWMIFGCRAYNVERLYFEGNEVVNTFQVNSRIALALNPQVFDLHVERNKWKMNLGTAVNCSAVWTRYSSVSSSNCIHRFKENKGDCVYNLSAGIIEAEGNELVSSDTLPYYMFLVFPPYTSMKFRRNIDRASTYFIVADNNYDPMPSGLLVDEDNEIIVASGRYLHINHAIPTKDLNGFKLFVKPSTGQLMIKFGMPTSDTDGAVVGSF
jgi:hypothetical protein